MAFRGQKGTDPFSTKTSRHERFAQMSQQELLIEQKKREIQAKLAQKQKPTDAAPVKTNFQVASAPEISSESSSNDSQANRKSQWRGGFDASKWKKPVSNSPVTQTSNKPNNVFANDGSFLDQFKKVAEGKSTLDVLKTTDEKGSTYINRDPKSNSRGGERPRDRDMQHTINKGDDRSADRLQGRTASALSPMPTVNVGRAPSPYSPTRASPDSSPQHTPQYIPGMPPPSLVNIGITPDLSQPPPLPGTLMPSPVTSVPPPIMPSTVTSVPPPIMPPVIHPSIPPPVLLTSTIPPPVSTAPSNIPSMQTIVNLPPPPVLTSQPPPLLQVPAMNIPPPNMANPPPTLPSVLQPQFPFNLPSGPPPLVTTAALHIPTSNPQVSMPMTSIPPPSLTSFTAVVTPSMAQAPTLSEVSPTVSNPTPVVNNTALTAPMAQLARMVAEGGDDIEDMARERNRDDPTMWFLYQQESGAYKQYRDLVERLRNAKTTGLAINNEAEVTASSTHGSNFGEDSYRQKRKRSRWGDKTDVPIPGPAVATVSTVPPPKIAAKRASQPVPLLSKVTRTDSNLLQYALKSYGTTQLSEEDWKKCEDHYKVHLLYHDMLRKREQLEKLQRAGKHKYEYDSDEETEGGTWEHKLRSQEMEATERWADELTKQAEGKHHIGDFLPPNELEKFMEKYNARKEGREPDLSDYKEYKLKEDNVGFKMLQKLGWSEGQGLGTEGQGMTDPVNKATVRCESQGLGLERPEEVAGHDDEYEAYRKRMMLAYRFRPNPLNNPRRSYY